MIFTKFRFSHQDELRRWDAFVESHPQGTPFHLSAWIRTLAEAYDLRPVLFGLSDDSGSLRAIAPFITQIDLFGRRRFVCLPFSDYCSPLGVEEPDLLKILEAIRREAPVRKARIEIRGPLPPGMNFFQMNYYKRHVLRLHFDPAEVMNRIDKRTLAYNIRKGRKAGVRIVEDNTLNGCEAYYSLNVLTRKKHGIPSQPKRFFKAFYRNLVQSGAASILLAVHGSRVVAGGIFFQFGDTAYFKYNASDPRAMIRLSPNHLLAWTAIEKACLKGLRFFDFGRTAPDNEGLTRYKKMWGAEAYDLPYSFYPDSSGLLKMGEHGKIIKTLKVIWRFLPEPVASRIGPIIIKYFG